MRDQPVLVSGNLTENQEYWFEEPLLASAERQYSDFVEIYLAPMISVLLHGGNTVDSKEVLDATRKVLSRMGCTRADFPMRWLGYD